MDFCEPQLFLATAFACGDRAELESLITFVPVSFYESRGTRSFQEVSRFRVGVEVSRRRGMWPPSLKFYLLFRLKKEEHEDRN